MSAIDLICAMGNVIVTKRTPGHRTQTLGPIGAQLRQRKQTKTRKILLETMLGCTEAMHTHRPRTRTNANGLIYPRGNVVVTERTPSHGVQALVLMGAEPRRRLNQQTLCATMLGCTKAMLKHMHAHRLQARWILARKSRMINLCGLM